MLERVSLDFYYKLAVVILLIIAALYLFQPIAMLLSKVPVDYNEGWNAYLSEKVRHGEPLYPKYDALISNNYPPLSFYLNACLSSIVGDDVIAGRIIALCSLIAVAGLLVACIRELGGRGLEATIMGVFFIAYICFIAKHYVGMDDPQWLGHAVQISGLYLLLKSKCKGATFHLSIFIIAAGGFVKHNLIPLPAAIFMWLLISDRRSLIRFLVTGLLTVGLLMAAFTAIHGIDFLHGLLLDCREWRLSWVAYSIDQRGTQLWITMMLGMFGFVLLPKSGVLRLLYFYFALACIWGFFTSGGRGVDQNAFFDIVISGTLLGGLVLGHMGRMEVKYSSAGRLVTLCLLGAIVLSVSLAVPHRLVDLRDFWGRWASEKESVLSDILYLSDADGPVMCEDLALCYWAGKKFEVDYFNTGQKMRAGVIDPEKFNKLIQSKYFSVIQVQLGSIKPFKLGDEAKHVIIEHYRIDRESRYFGEFLVPK
jgi:hypothetical protein